MSIENITFLHLDLDNASQDAERSPIIAQILFTLRDILVTTSGNETFYNISYDQIAKVIFENDCRIDEESLLSLKTLVKYELGKLFVYTGWSEEEERTLQFKKDHLVECYSKLVTHIHLSFIQKTFIEISAHQAFSIASDASNKALESLKQSNLMANEIRLASANAQMAYQESVDASDKAHRALGDAKEAADKSQTTLENLGQARIDLDNLLARVKDTQDSANSAAEQASKAVKEAENTSKNITTQFVTILGIFASIIVALFGGMSLVKAAVELLTNEGSLPLFVFVVSVLMLSFSSLIVLLTTWITSLNKEKSEKSYLCTKVILFGFLIVCCFGSGLISYDLSQKPKIEKGKTRADLKFELKAN